MSQKEYNDLINNPSPVVAAAKTDPLFEFDPVTYKVSITGEFRELGLSENRRKFRNLLSNELFDPEAAIGKFGTDAYKAKTKNRRDRARRDLDRVALPDPPIPPPAGVAGMDAADSRRGPKTGPHPDRQQ